MKDITIHRDIPKMFGSGNIPAHYQNLIREILGAYPKEDSLMPPGIWTALGESLTKWYHDQLDQDGVYTEDEAIQMMLAYLRKPIWEDFDPDQDEDNAIMVYLILEPKDSILRAIDAHSGSRGQLGELCQMLYDRGINTVSDFDLFYEMVQANYLMEIGCLIYKGPTGSKKSIHKHK